MGWDQGWNILILWRFTEKSDFKGGIHKKPIYRGELPEKVGLGQFGNLRRGGGLGKKERGWYPNAQYDTRTICKLYLTLNQLPVLFF